jgi:hypothetical protein
VQETVTIVHQHNVIVVSRILPTDSVISTIVNKNMRMHLGAESRPPVALRYSHVAFNQEFGVRQYGGCGDEWLSKYEYAAANFSETCEWGGWLRASETFYVDDDGVEIISPANGGLHNFHIGVGSDLLTLGPETKGQSSKRVGVPLTDKFAPGVIPH